MHELINLFPLTIYKNLVGLDLKEREKSGRIREYNLIYKKKYGNNKVIESEVL